MNNKTFVFISIVCIADYFFIPPNCVLSQSNADERDESYYQEEGLKHFQKGFYKLEPQGKDVEARKHYQLAIKAFKQALKLQENKETRRYLARVYYVQKNYVMAAEEYEIASELDPYDIDLYVELALAYMYQEKYNKAIRTLETAKSYTFDEDVIMKLNGYIATAEKVKKGKEDANDTYK